MKTKTCFLTVFTSLCWIAHGQGTFIYDQQSVPSDFSAGEASVSITTNQPMGQSFAPALDSLGFVRLQLFDATFSNSGVGATVYVDLWSDSIGGGGQLLGSTAPVYLPVGFGRGGTSPLVADTNFFFSIPVTVTPGQTYYLQPVVQSGDDILAGANIFNYPGGSLFVKGTAQVQDLWFREGIYSVPEPPPWWLVLLGSGILICFRHRRAKHTEQWVHQLRNKAATV